jgi:hypothetical protein
LVLATAIDYISAYTGKRTATFTPAGTKTVYKADTLTLNENRYYSLFLANTAGHEEFVLLKDTITRPADGKASIRFINLSPDAPAADLVIKDGATLAANKGVQGFFGLCACCRYGQIHPGDSAGRHLLPYWPR